MIDLPTSLRWLKEAAAAGRIQASTADHVHRWLTDPAYAKYQAEIMEHIAARRWPELDSAFWTVLPFGTAGRRGRMYPIGCNTVNSRTIAETVLATALDCEEAVPHKASRVACVGFDVRHHSWDFAKIACEVLAQRNWKIYLLEDPRSTPQLAISVRHFQADVGFMITASHNPPSDNAVKVFGEHGGQIRPPVEFRIADRIGLISEIDLLPFDDAVRLGRVESAVRMIDPVYVQAIRSRSLFSPANRRSVRILYSPLQGVGMHSVFPVLGQDQFPYLRTFGPQTEPDPDFSAIPGQMANPEEPRVFEPLFTAAMETPTDLILASDPDADRIGCAAPRNFEANNWVFLSGNQIGVLLAEFLLSTRAARGLSTPKDYLVRTLVTTPMLDRIAAQYGAQCHNHVLTGFKWIGGLVENLGADGFVMGCEEAHGYLLGDHIRDKDAGAASLALAEYADQLMMRQETFLNELDRLYLKYGCYQEQSLSVPFPGPAGMAAMQAIMDHVRSWTTSKPGGSGTPFTRKLAGHSIIAITDYLQGIRYLPNGNQIPRPAIFPGNVLWLELDQPGLCIALRPSGTEPKIKFYFFGRHDVASMKDVRHAQADLAAIFDSLASELRSLCQSC